MEKLAEREDALRSRSLAAAPALAVQFFLIPLAVVGVMVLVYAGVQLLLGDSRTAAEYLSDVRTGGRERRWPAAYELSRLLADPAVQTREPGIGPALLRAFEEAKGDDPRVRRYLALALGRLKPPPAGATAALVGAAQEDDADVVIAAVWALGAGHDSASVPALLPLATAPNPEIRKIVVYVLGALPGDAQVPALAVALGDSTPDVRWNAAVALARHGRREGVPVLRQMLDRAYLERTVTEPADPTREIDRVSEIMISGLRALAALGDPDGRPTVERLSREDRSLKVRQAAIEALRAERAEG